LAEGNYEFGMTAPLFVMGGFAASVVQVRVLHLPPPGSFPPDLALWMPFGGATLHLEGRSQPIPGGSVIEFQDWTTITIPEPNPLRFPLVPDGAVGYFHFPLLASEGCRFFTSVARDPQGFIQALRNHIRTGLTSIRRHAGNDSDPPPEIRLVDMLDVGAPGDM